MLACCANHIPEVNIQFKFFIIIVFCLFVFCMYLLKLKHPDMVEGLVLINMSAQAEGFMDWAAQKVQKLVSYC